MQRRRLTPMAKEVFYAVNRCLDGSKPESMVFASIHGETPRSFALLNTLGNNELLSPTAFSLSVHNAIAGQISISLKLDVPLTVMAPDYCDLTSPLLEASSQLRSEGHETLLLVLYDDIQPEFYVQHGAREGYDGVAALLLARHREPGSIQLQIEQSTEVRSEKCGSLSGLASLLDHSQTELATCMMGNSWTIRCDCE